MSGLPEVVSTEEWEARLAELRAKEKAHTRAGDALAAERRRLPMVRFRADYRLEGAEGQVTLLDLFDGRPQLVIYHFMLQPGDAEPCGGCSLVADNVGHPVHINVRGVSRAFVANAPYPEIAVVKERMGWREPFYSAAGDTFQQDCGITTGFGLSVFLRDGDDVFRTYFTRNRGAEVLGNNWSFLDLTPYGRQETWEDTPEGRPQGAPYEWWHLREYS